MLTVVDADGERAVAAVLPAPRAIVSWATDAPAGTLELIVHTVTGRASSALPYVAFEPGARASLDGFDAVAHVDTDVVYADGEIAAIEVRANVPLARIAVSVPVHAAAAPVPTFAGELDVPTRSQHVDGVDASRGWCAPAAIAMLVGAHVPATPDVADVASAVYDRAYAGTGNWAFCTAYAASHGLFGAAAYLRGMASLDALLAAGLSFAASISWADDDLPGVPIPSSDGHLVVVRGRTASGDVIVNDPAQPAVRCVYPAEAFAGAWTGHGGVALLVAPLDRIDDAVRCANA